MKKPVVFRTADRNRHILVDAENIEMVTPLDDERKQPILGKCCLLVRSGSNVGPVAVNGSVDDIVHFLWPEAPVMNVDGDEWNLMDEKKD